MPRYITRQRKQLQAYLTLHADESLTPHQIVSDLSDTGISLSAVYRNLAALEAEGKIRRMGAGAGRESIYQYAAADGCKACLHLSCQHCGRTFHMDMQTADALMRQVSSQDGFVIDTSATVLYGICGNCQSH